MADNQDTHPHRSEPALEQYRDKVVNLLRYLEEYVKLKVVTAALDVSRYADEGYVLWFHEIPESKDVFCRVLGGPAEGLDDLWLKVRKQVLIPCPELPNLIEPWVEISEIQRSGEAEPQLRPVAYLSVPPAGQVEAMEGLLDGQVSDEPTQPRVWLHRIEEHPEVREEWQRYLTKWHSWSEKHSRQAAIQKIYSTLYSAYQKQKRFGEAYELVVGLGLLSALKTNGQRIRRHVVVAQAQLDFDSKEGVVTLLCPPPPEGAHLQIEDEFLEPDERPDREAYKEFGEQLQLLDDAIWDREKIDRILRIWANSLQPAPGPRFEDGLIPPKITNIEPVLTFAPALILRKRNQRGTLAFYRKLIENIIKGDSPVPFGFAQLVDYLEDTIPNFGHIGDYGSGNRSDTREPEEVFFPLRSNDQQRDIVRQLGCKRGVLVQGPPGTGKSQTIANLICHLLATGKRVLVTSETARALTVLNEKIPNEVKSLCVSLLGADQNSLSELKSSIREISSRHSHWNPETREALKKSIINLERELSKHRERKAEIQRTLREFREAGSKTVTIGDGTYEGTAQEIAKRVYSEKPRYHWLQPIEVIESKPPVSDYMLTELWSLLHEFPNDDDAEIGREIVDVGSIPAPSDFARCVRTIEESQMAFEKYKHLTGDPSFRGLLSASPECRHSLVTDGQAFLLYSGNLSHRKESWLIEACSEILADHDMPWAARAKTTREALNFLKPKAEQLDRVRLKLPDGFPVERVLSDAHAALEHLESGGRWSVLGFKPRSVRNRQYLRYEVFVDGQTASSCEMLRVVNNLLEARRWAFDAGALWGLSYSPETTSLLTWVAELEECIETIDIVFKLLDVAHSIAKQVHQLTPSMPLPQWSRSGIECLLGVCEAASVLDDSKRASALLDPARRILEDVAAIPGSHVVNRCLLDALIIGNTQAWAENYSLASLLRSKHARLAKRDSLAELLSKAVPSLLERLIGNLDDQQWPTRLEDFEAAWRWAFADRWLANYRNPNSVKVLEGDLRICDRHIADCLTNLAADKAWSNLLSRMTEKQKQNLLSFSFNIQWDKGTGIRAAKSRNAAQRNIEECRDSIPVWIMPRYRVVDIFDPLPNLFDVVIVDEASQTSIDGLFIYGLAHQVLIVGDDQQISPSEIGIQWKDVDALSHRFLQDIPFPMALTPKVSLYTHAKIRFGGQVVLREHFRCVPEIIGFSDKLCYAPNGTPLIPLRNYEPSRIEPILTRFIRDGFQEGKASNAVNRPEAQAIVSQIVACANDPRYEDKTFGVISLLGEAQARLIERQLLSALGPEQMEERRLVCGDAYAFQGDERNVIFLSMVSAPNARIGPLAGQDAIQRFNVAASRAQDQLWLFHSVAIEDLSETCVRRKLLSYCLNPTDPDQEQEPKFDSVFEQDVYKRIREKGFRVRTQVPGGDQTTYRYRIDLVIEGERQRLAVECDGDEWHGLDRYEADMHRQRLLERAGWTFFRIWGGDYYRDPDMALDLLWRELDRLGIEPRVDHRSRTSPPPPSDDPKTSYAPDFDFSTESEEDAPAEAAEETDDVSDNGVTETTVISQPPSGTGPPIDKVDIPVEPPTSKKQDTNSTKSSRVVINSDMKQLEYFDSVPLMDWADLAQWADSRSQWDLTRRNLVKRVAKAVAVGKSLPDYQRIWAARLHSLACRIGFQPHPPGEMNVSASGQGRLPFDDEKPN